MTATALQPDPAAAGKAVAPSKAKVAVVPIKPPPKDVLFPGGAVRFADAPMPPPAALPPPLLHWHRLMFSTAKAVGEGPKPQTERISQ